MRMLQHSTMPVSAFVDRSLKPYLIEITNETLRSLGY